MLENTLVVAAWAHVTKFACAGRSKRYSNVSSSAPGDGRFWSNFGVTWYEKPDPTRKNCTVVLGEFCFRGADGPMGYEPPEEVHMSTPFLRDRARTLAQMLYMSILRPDLARVVSPNYLIVRSTYVYVVECLEGGCRMINELWSCTHRPPRLRLFFFPLLTRQISSNITNTPLSSTATKTYFLCAIRKGPYAGQIISRQ